MARESCWGRQGANLAALRVQRRWLLPFSEPWWLKRWLPRGQTCLSLPGRVLDPGVSPLEAIEFASLDIPPPAPYRRRSSAEATGLRSRVLARETSIRRRRARQAIESWQLRRPIGPIVSAWLQNRSSVPRASGAAQPKIAFLSIRCRPQAVCLCQEWRSSRPRPRRLCLAQVAKTYHRRMSRFAVIERRSSQQAGCPSGSRDFRLWAAVPVAGGVAAK